MSEINTRLWPISENELHNYKDMLFALWPYLEWRHAGIGMLQAYIKQGTERELRVHVWHPSLVKDGIKDSGLCHDHRFTLRSSVLVGRIHQTEIAAYEYPDGEWETWQVVHARKAMAEGGSFHRPPERTGNYYSRTERTYVVEAGFGYTFNKFAFHESWAEGLTVTLVEKHDQTDHQARILAPRGAEIVHAFSETMKQPDFQHILDEALAALGEQQ